MFWWIHYSYESHRGYLHRDVALLPWVHAWLTSSCFVVGCSSIWPHSPWCLFPILSGSWVSKPTWMSPTSLWCLVCGCWWKSLCSSCCWSRLQSSCVLVPRCHLDRGKQLQFISKDNDSHNHNNSTIYSNLSLKAYTSQYNYLVIDRSLPNRKYSPIIH